MRLFRVCVVVPFLTACTGAPESPTSLSPSDEAAAFAAAGYAHVGAEWHLCESPPSGSYTPGRVSEVRDLDGDGLPEAVLTEGGAACYGAAGAGFSLVSKRTDGVWTRVTSGVGIPRFLRTTGEGGWPDLEVGGPGFCFAILRWDGTDYREHRHEYQGRPCEPDPPGADDGIRSAGAQERSRPSNQERA